MTSEASTPHSELVATIRAGIAPHPDEPTDVGVTLERNALAALDSLEEQLEQARKERSDAVEVAARAMDRSQSLEEQLEATQRGWSADQRLSDDFQSMLFACENSRKELQEQLEAKQRECLDLSEAGQALLEQVAVLTQKRNDLREQLETLGRLVDRSAELLQNAKHGRDGGWDSRFERWLEDARPLRASNPASEPEEVREDKRPCPNCGANDWTFLAGKREGEHGQCIRWAYCNHCEQSPAKERQ